MHLFLWAEDSEAELRAELTATFPGALIATPRRSCVTLEGDLDLDQPLPYLVFSRQWLPAAQPAASESIRAWAETLFSAVTTALPENQPWSLHVAPHYGLPTRQHRIGARAWHTQGMSRGRRLATSPQSALEYDTPSAEAGRHRCQLIRKAFEDLMRRKRRHLLKCLRSEPATFTATDSLVQLLLTSPDAGYISVASAPLPHCQRHLLSPFPKGELEAVTDRNAPSRAFNKLIEAERRLGTLIGPGDCCVDLGAAPGSWTFVAANRNARVIAVDRSPLREDLMRNPRVEFQPGDAFRFEPPRPVDWLLCDVIAAPERTTDLLLNWLRRGWCRRFIVTLKMGDSPAPDALEILKRELPQLTADLFLTRLCANKKEICAFGAARS